MKTSVHVQSVNIFQIILHSHVMMKLASFILLQHFDHFNIYSFDFILNKLTGFIISHFFKSVTFLIVFISVTYQEYHKT